MATGARFHRKSIRIKGHSGRGGSLGQSDHGAQLVEGLRPLIHLIVILAVGECRALLAEGSPRASPGVRYLETSGLRKGIMSI